MPHSVTELPIAILLPCGVKTSNNETQLDAEGVQVANFLDALAQLCVLHFSTLFKML